MEMNNNTRHYIKRISWQSDDGMTVELDDFIKGLPTLTVSGGRWVATSVSADEDEIVVLVVWHDLPR